MPHKLKPHVPPRVKNPIKTKNPPGGPHTPGAKADRAKALRDKKKRAKKKKVSSLKGRTKGQWK